MTYNPNVQSSDITDGTIAAADLADGIITGGTAGSGVKIAATTITNANISTSAGIVDTKLDLSAATTSGVTPSSSAKVVSASSTTSSQNIGAASPTGGFSINKVQDNWSDNFAHSRSSECSTMPRFLSQTSNTMVSGTIYAVRCVYTGNQPSHQFTGMRWMFSTYTSTGVTNVTGGIWDSTGAPVTNGNTGDVKASISSSALATVPFAASATITLTPGAVYHLGVVAVFSGTAPVVRGAANSAAVVQLTPTLTKAATGFTSGTLPSLGTTSIIMPWIELT